MTRERSVNWKQVFEDTQETLDAQRRGEIGQNETLVTASGREYAQDLDRGKWTSIPITERMRILDDLGNL